MEHPIPQDITGFQFRLIGDMTVKQFAYIASFAVLGWIVFSSSIFVLIKIPIAAFLFLFGLSLAFLPIEGRPFDVMIANFIRALFNPTQFVYEKTGGHLYAQAHKLKAKSEKLKAEEPQPIVLQTKKKTEEDKKEMVYFSQLANYQSSYQNLSPNPIPTGASPHAFDKVQFIPEEKTQERSKNEKKEKEMEERQRKLEEELLLAKQQEKSAPDPQLAKKAHEETLSLEEELRKTVDEKNRLEQQLIELSRKLEQQKKTFFTPSVPQAPVETKNVRVVPQGQGARVGLPITPESPNVISGIVKDPRGNPLSNILVEVKDQDANPVRAFKTNGVGQFASATALTNGVYTIEFEDPKEENKFDAIQFEAKGEVILPIEVISTDKREELRRELFTN